MRDFSSDWTSGLQSWLAGRALVLASASPRRHELLGRTGLPFEVDPADTDETMDLELDAAAIAEELGLRKARVVAERRTAGAQAAAERAGCVVIGSDTVVVLGEDGDPGRRFLEKAADAEEARAMLEALSGTRHRVITGVAVVVTSGGASPGSVSESDSRSESRPAPKEFTDHETTWVTMRDLTADEIADYVASGEWEGKAGAYAIQGTADRFVDALEGGGFDNVVGLPVARTLELIGRAAQGHPGSP